MASIVCPKPYACSLKGSMEFSSSMKRVPGNLPNGHKFTKFSVISCCGGGGGGSISKVMEESEVTDTNNGRVSFGFKNLTETFWIDVHGAEGRELSVELDSPLIIGCLSHDKVENVAVRVELKNGCAGWGEITVLPSAGGTSQRSALARAKEACRFLLRSAPTTLNVVLNEIDHILPGPELAPVRAGVEMALIDAVANSIDVPLWRLFGGVSNSVTTAISIPNVSPERAYELASHYRDLGFQTLKFNLGMNIDDDVETLRAMMEAHPRSSMILRANEQCHITESVIALRRLHNAGIVPILYEQPVGADVYNSLYELSEVARGKYGISVALEQDCYSSVDMNKVMRDNLADVISIRLPKSGLICALDVIDLARKTGMGMMITSTIETRLATGFAGHLAAGLGCFKYVCLDMPFLLQKDPVIGGFEASGPVYKFVNARGQGGFLKWDVLNWSSDGSLIIGRK